MSCFPKEKERESAFSANYLNVNKPSWTPASVCFDARRKRCIDLRRQSPASPRSTVLQQQVVHAAFSPRSENKKHRGPGLARCCSPTGGRARKARAGTVPFTALEAPLAKNNARTDRDPRAPGACARSRPKDDPSVSGVMAACKPPAPGKNKAIHPWFGYSQADNPTIVSATTAGADSGGTAARNACPNTPEGRTNARCVLDRPMYVRDDTRMYSESI